MRRVAILLAVLAAACNSSSTVTPTTLVFDRPVDISFACYGALRITGGGSADPSQPIQTTAQPIASCDTRAQEVPMGTKTPPRPPGQEDLSGSGGSDVTPVQYYGFVLESASDTVALVNFDSKAPTSFAGGINQDVKPVDADPLTPGENGISVGDLPIAIATDKVGCFELTANAGSCDMSTLSINEALGGSAGIHVDKLEVKNAGGQPVHAKPAAMVSEPPGGTIGVACPMQPTGLVYIAYPSCHLVAAVDSSSGAVVAGISFASGTPAIVDGNVSCPDECAGEPVTPGVRPVALDLEQDPTTGRRALLIGADNSSSLTLVDLDTASKPMGTPQQIALEDKTPNKTLGVSAVALSPQIGMGGSNDQLNDAMEPQFQFAYAVATDRSVRVAEVQHLYKECDTQVDPRYLHDVKDVTVLSCMPVGDPATPPRRPGAHSPGIELPSSGVPNSVTVVKVPRYDGDNRDPTQPSTLIGYFGVITATNGLSYVFNIDDEHRADFVGGPEGQNGSLTNPLESMIPLDIANQLRDDVPDRGAIAQTQVNMMEVPSCDAAQPPVDVTQGGSGGPRAPSDPQRSVPAGYIASDKENELPSIQQVLCQAADDTKPVSELLFQAPIDIRDLVFPDLRALAVQENWTLTWEGLLSLDQPNSAVDGPPVRTGNLTVNSSGLFLDDATQPFCDAGVEPYDIAQLRGCDPSLGDTQCPKGYTCFVHPESKIAGLGSCMPSDEASLLATACKDFLTTLRRYTIVKASTGELQLIPRKHELRTTPVDGCTSDTQCAMLATYAAQNASSANPVDDKTAPDTHTWTCALDPDRGGSPTKRCLETCQTTADCIDGYACENGFCMESVIPPQACVNAPQRYDLRAHDAFTVIGTVSGYIHPIIAQPGTGACVRNPNANRLDIGRIPLTAPACDPTADPRTGALPGGGFEPNPCETTVAQSELDPVFMPGTCTPANPSTQLVSRMADAIKFRNRGLTLTMVDPTYPGDATCVGDRMGNLGRIPLVSSLFQLVFQQAAGFKPLFLNASAAFPAKVVRGPGQSIWVIDEGDVLTDQFTGISTAGQVFRIESQALQTVNQVQ